MYIYMCFEKKKEENCLIFNKYMTKKEQPSII